MEVLSSKFFLSSYTLRNSRNISRNKLLGRRGLSVRKYNSQFSEEADVDDELVLWNG